VGRVSDLTAKHPELEELVEMFKTVDIVSADVIREKAIVLPDDDKVFRKADTSGSLIPADAATSLVLRRGLTKPPTLEELHSLVGGTTVAPSHARPLPRTLARMRTLTHPRVHGFICSWLFSSSCGTLV